MPVLRVKIPGQPVETHALAGPRVSIGRRADNAIQILDPSVSAYHAELVAAHGHYRLRDLQSTNACLVDGRAVADYHLRDACTIVFGTVECEFDPARASEEPLSPAQLEQEVAFLRSENAGLHAKNCALERQLAILGSAQLFSEKRGPERNAAALAAELEATREELAIALRARDAARTAAGMLHSEKATILREFRASGIRRL